MKFLSEKDDLNQLEENVINKFRWDWFNIEDNLNDKIGAWCRKIDQPGTCFCTCCNSSIRYASEGFKALLRHSSTAAHQKARKSVQNTQFLFSYSSPSTSSDISADRTVDLITRKCRAEALITSFIGEHALSFSLAPDLLELSKTLSKDQTALNSLQMSRTTAAYKLKYGLAKTVKDEQFNILQETFFSLNIDESTNKANESILTTLVQYYCDIEEKVILRHLMSVKLPACTSDNIFQAIVSAIEDNNIPWKNLVSLLMDSCNTMRGMKNGVEVQIRNEKAPHLLDIDGDTCHTVNNSAKKFTEVFLKHIEILCDDVYFDLKSSSKREIFFELCLIMGVKPLKPLSRPDHRWLYVLLVIERLEYLWDVLIVFYFTWLQKEDAETFRGDMESVFEKHQLSSSQIDKVKEIQSSLKKKHLTEDGKKRKQRIIKRIFDQKKKTFLHFGIYKSVLQQFNTYVKLFQKKTVSLHLIHVELFNLTKQFLAFFIKHDSISSASTVGDLLKINFDDPNCYLPNNLIYLGMDSSKIVRESKKNNPVIKEFIETVKKAYSRCASYMLKKLPLKNSSLIKFSGLDPDLRGKTATFTALVKLAESSNIISETEFAEFDKEVRLYQVDSDLEKTDSTNVESFWASVFKMKQGGEFKYPHLSKLIKAVLTCFHGPHVESAFNNMGNIMTSNRTSLNIESLDSVQTIKYYLLSKNATTCEVFGSKNPMNDPIQKSFADNLIKSRAYYQQTLDLKNCPIAAMSSNILEDNNLIKECDNDVTSASKEIIYVPSTSNSSSVKRSHSPEKKLHNVKQTKIASFFKKKT